MSNELNITPQSDLNGNPTVLRNDYIQPQMVNEGLEKKIDGMHLFSGITIIAIGQGGMNVALGMEEYLRKFDNTQNVVLINSAQSDLDAATSVPPSRKYLISDDGSGAGKKREYAKNIFYDPKDQDRLFNKIIDENKCLLFGPNRIIMVIFSAGGGTGSAIGPKFVAKLTRYCQTTKEPYMLGVNNSGIPVNTNIDPYRPNVIGCCLAPDYRSDSDSGTDTISNALECMKEIDIVIKNKLGSFFIVENKISNEGKGLFNKTNTDLANGFVKFIKYIGVSSDTILDVKDRFVALSNPGLMAFTDLYGYTYGTLQPVKGSTILTVVSELVNINQQEKLAKWQQFASDYIISDSTVGWNDLSILPPEEQNNELRKRDIILLSGFNNIAVIMEGMKETLDRKMANMKNKELNGKAFNNLDDIKAERNNERSKNVDTDINALF